MNRLNFTDIQKLSIVQDYNNKMSSIDISKKYNCSCPTILSLLRNNNIKIRDAENAKRRKTLNVDYFEKIDNQNKAYLLGLLYADGCVKNKQLTLKLINEDRYLLEFLCKELGYDGKFIFIPSIKKSQKDRCSVTISSKKLCETLTKHGCMPNKTYLLNFPSQETISNELMPHFLRGFMDGDGSIRLTRESSYLNFSGTFDMIQGIATVIKKKFGFVGNIYNIYSHKNCGVQIFYCKVKEIIQILDWLYRDATYFMLRKKNKYDIFFQRKPIIRTDWTMKELQKTICLYETFKSWRVVASLINNEFHCGKLIRNRKSLVYGINIIMPKLLKENDGIFYKSSLVSSV